MDFHQFGCLFIRVVDPDPDLMTLSIRNPVSGSGSRGKKLKKNKYRYFFSLFYLFLLRKGIKIVETANILFEKILSSQVPELLWIQIRIRIRSGFNDIVDPDPFPD
jgi:hypothetical protein